MCSIAPSPSIVGIFDSVMFSLIPNGNVNMRLIYANDIIVYVQSIGDVLHACIENNIPFLRCYYVDTPVSCSHWIFLKNMYSL